ncbi:hypothetical protein AVEN_112789-1 [Araneus ventricosus]|uniref:Uncharacterized protein n=1 Tax=Araneus ventricosus TaxID=182803 RepID=A0A4Y2JDN7_ARAVE|nr:hypothetical protein AVEN_112789-1 [Araneus ventricosus]
MHSYVRFACPIRALQSYNGTLLEYSMPICMRAPGSTPDSTVPPEDPSCIGPATPSVIRRGENFARWCGTEVKREGCQLRCLPHHMIAVPNDEVRPKIALVLLRYYN